MARRLGFPLRDVQVQVPAFCSTDARLLVKEGDEMNISVRVFGSWSYVDVPLALRTTREMRALAVQLNMLADRMEGAIDLEEVLPSSDDDMTGNDRATTPR